MMTVTATKTTKSLPIGAAGCAAVAIGFGFARYGFGLFASVFRAEFGMTTSAIGAVGSAASVIYLISLLSCGALTARWGPRLPVLIANMSAVTGLALIACATTAPMLTAGVLIAAASSGLVWGPFADAVGECVAPERQDRTLAIVSSGTTFGLVVAGALAFVVADRPGQLWRVIWCVFTTLAVVVMVLAYVAMPDAGTTTSVRPRRGRFRPTPASIPICLLSALYGGAGAVFFTFAVDLVHSEGLSPSWSALLWLMVGLGGVSGVVTGSLVNRFGMRRSLTAATALMAASIVVLAAWPSIAGLAALAALGFGCAYMPFAALLAIWNQRLHPLHPTSGLVLTLCSLGAGSVIGPASLAMLADAIGLRAAYLLAAVLLVVCGLPLCRHAK
jgi:predicted MFS family arabinose efflux permease